MFCRNPKRSANNSGVDGDSLNPNTMNSSAASSFGDRDSKCSALFHCGFSKVSTRDLLFPGSVASPGRSSMSSRPRRAKAPISLKEKSLNT